MTTGELVEADIELTRFHALTPKARYTTGGDFATRFVLDGCGDLATGQIVDGPRRVAADLLASGGERAMEEEAAGITEKVEIEDHVAKVIAHELSQRLVPKDQVLETLNENPIPPGAVALTD